MRQISAPETVLRILTDIDGLLRGEKSSLEITDKSTKEIKEEQQTELSYKRKNIG